MYEFNGLYTWGEVLTTVCSGGLCKLQVPQEFFLKDVFLSVYENDFKGLFRALAAQAKADGYLLTYRNNFVSVSSVPLNTVSYVSCVDSLVHTVSSSDLALYLKSDSLRCFVRDSLKTENFILKVPDVYKVSFYTVSSSFVSSLGVDWTSVFASGDLVSLPSLITDWTLKAVNSNDSLSEYRSITLSLDTLSKIHWGSQIKQEENTVIYENGVSNTSYTWRNFGLTLTLRRSLDGVNCEYKLLQNDESNSILEGSFNGGLDSLASYGVYDSYYLDVKGVPVLSSLPLVGPLFTIDNSQKVTSFFAIIIQLIEEKEK